jgi:hypothetical protein
MQPKLDPGINSDQMLMAGYILQAFENGGMPMHAAGYFELAAWAAHELRALDTVTLQEMCRAVPRALRDVINNLLYDRSESERVVDGVAGMRA